MTSKEPQYRVDFEEGFTAVTLGSALNSAPWAEIEKLGAEILERVNEQKTSHLLVDLSPLNYIGSSMVALVVRLWKSIKEKEGRLAVVSKHPVVLEVLQIAGLNQIWSIVKTRDEALTELGVQRTRCGTMVLSAVGLVSAAAALSGLAIRLSPDLAVKPEIFLSLELGGAGLGLVLGLVNLIRGTGAQRILAVVALLICLGVGVAGIMTLLP